MKNILPSYAQSGWGTSLNNYLSRLNSHVLSLQKEIDSVKGEVGATLTKYAGSGFTTNGTSLTIFKTNEDGQQAGMDEAVLASRVIYDNSEGQDVNLMNYQIRITGGSVYLSASLYYQTGRLYNLNVNTLPTTSFKELFLKLTGENDATLISSLKEGVYEIVLSEVSSVKHQMELKLIPSAVIQGDLVQGQEVRWLSPDICKIGYITVLRLSTGGQEHRKVIFTPAPSICTNSSGTKELLMLSPKAGQVDIQNNFPLTYRYTLEGGDYFLSKASSTETAENLVVPYSNITKINSERKFYIFSDLETNKKDVKCSMYNSEDLSNKDKFEQDILYIGYLTNSGTIILRNTGLATTNTLDTTLDSIEVSLFNDKYPLYKGAGAVEYIRLVNSSTMGRLLFTTKTIALEGPVFNSTSSRTPWGAMGIQSNSGYLEGDDPTKATGALFFVPVIGDGYGEEVTSKKYIANPNKIIVNLSGQEGNNDEKRDFLMKNPRLLTYDSLINDTINFYGEGNKPQIKLTNVTNNKTTTIDSESLTINDTILDETGLTIGKAPENIVLNQSGLSLGSKIKLDTTSGLSMSTDSGKILLSTSGLQIQEKGGSAEAPTYTDKIKINANGLNIDENILVGTVDENVKGILIKGAEEGGVADIKLTPTAVQFAKLCTINSTGINTSVPLVFTSDRRYKENIQKFNCSAIEKIKSLPVYTYNLIGSTNNTIGIMAQDLLKQVPSLVHFVKDDIRDDKMVIEEHKLVFLCLKAIQELSAELEAIKENVYE